MRREEVWCDEKCCTPEKEVGGIEGFTGMVLGAEVTGDEMDRSCWSYFRDLNGGEIEVWGFVLWWCSYGVWICCSMVRNPYKLVNIEWFVREKNENGVMIAGCVDVKYMLFFRDCMCGI